MEKRKILIINTAPFNLNGISSMIMNYYSALDKNILTCDFIINREIDPKYERELKLYDGNLYILNRNKNLFLYSLELLKIINRNKYDFVHVHGNSASMIFETLPAKLLGVKQIAVHSHNTTCNSIRLHKFLNPLFQHTFNIALACGEQAGYWMFGKKKFQVLKNGIEIEKFRFSEQDRQQLRNTIINSEDFVLGHVGAFNPAKNHTFLIDLFKKVKDRISCAKLVLVGDGRLRNDIEQKIQKLGLEDSIILIGKTPNVEKYLSAFDLFLLPSLFEGFPVTLIEAQASGLNCFVTDNIDVEVNITGGVNFLKTNEHDIWVNKIISYYRGYRGNITNRLERSNLYIQKLEEKGYDKKKSVSIIKDLYEGK